MAGTYKGQPFELSMFLPAGMTADDLYVIAAGLAAGIASFAIGSSFIERDGQTKRLKALQERRAELKGEMSKTRRRKRPEGSVNFMRRVVNKFQLLKSSQVTQVQELLIEAGFRSKDALVIFMFFTLVLPILMIGPGLLMMGLDYWETSKMRLLKFAMPILFVYVGMKLPYWIAARARKKRYYKIQKALSDTLDLMTICAEAGLSLNMSLERVSRELGMAYPEMASELAMTSMELGFLPDRNKALLNLTERVKLPEVRGIISVLIQTEKYGTPIAQALRVLSAEFREQRMLRAENKAARLPALMTVPMIIFILPTLFIIIIAPAAIQIMDVSK